MCVLSYYRIRDVNSIKIMLLFAILVTINSFFSLPAISATQTAAQASLPATSQAIFDKGKASFNEKDYAAAASYFKQAEEQGMVSPALYYNLASCYYMLGEYENSSKYFNKVRGYREMQDIAEYNLGLVSSLQDDQVSAEKWFNSVVKNSNDKKLVFLAETKLKSIESQKKPEWVTDRWSAYASAALGYDDNVNFAPLGITAEQSDSFSEIYATADYLLSGDRKNGWLGEIYFYDINYQTEDLYDESEYGAKINKYLQLNRDWQTIYSLDIAKVEYNHEDYQTIAKIAAESRNWLSNKEQLLLRYSYEDINSDNAPYDYLEGWRQKLRAQYSLYHRQDTSRFYYELEFNDRNDLSVASGDYSYSPTRHLFLGKHTSVLSQQWHLTGELSYRASEYPQTANQDRSDDRVRAAVYTDYRFTNDVKLRAKVVYTDNGSTDDFYDYEQTVYTLGLHAYF